MLKYHNIENFKFPSSEEIFLQPFSYNEYTGFNKYPIYAWFSIEHDIVWTTGELKDRCLLSFESSKWICKEVYAEITIYFQFSLIESGLIILNNQKYLDVQFLIRFDWDEGDRSVGIWPGYNVSLILNNNLPIYRTFDYVSQEENS